MTYKWLQINSLKEEYQHILIPDELDQVISNGLSEGRTKISKNKFSKYMMNLCASILIAVLILTGAINISPAFASALSEMPVIGRMVEILTFVDGQSKGGDITDGTDISDIYGIQNGNQEEIIINFSQLKGLQSVTAAYNVRYYDSPTVLQFDIGGARMISAEEDFQQIKELDTVKDIYTLMTLDDSLIRLNIVFNYPVRFEVHEFVDPAGIKIIVSKMEGVISEEIFVVRTASYPLSESFGHLEEELMWVEDVRVSKKYRILKDDADAFAFEFASFSSEKQAIEFLNEIENLISMPLHIEKRQSEALPKYMEQNNERD